MGEDGVPREPKRTGRWVIVRSAAELLVIVVGVVIGLAVDRWMAGIDGEVQAERLVERLVVDIRQDSIELESFLEDYQEQGNALVDVLGVIADPSASVSDPTDFIRKIELTSWWVPFSPNGTTWGEINSTGQLGLLEPELRSALAGYYGSLDYLAEMEDRWAPAIQEYWSLQQVALPPLIRLAAVESRYGGPRARDLTHEEVDPVLTAFRERPALYGSLGRLTAIYLYGAPGIEGARGEAIRALAALESR